jgi:hypothetical protein
MERMITRRSRKLGLDRILLLISVLLLTALLAGTPVLADHPEDDNPAGQSDELHPHRDDPSAALIRRDQLRENALSVAAGSVSGAAAEKGKVKGLNLVARGERLLPGATTDVWVHRKFAYIGTFNTPCGDGTGDNGSGVRIFDAKNPRKGFEQVSHIPSVLGSRSNDVKVAKMRSGNILVHSNESCAGGPGGFEIWNVDDPLNPVHLAHVQTDDVNGFLRDAFGFVDFGVHNLWLFRNKGRDYVGAVVESEFGNFQIFDITDPTNPELAGFWGAEELRMVELGLDPSTVPDLDGDDFGTILDLDAWLFDGFGASQNRFLHDITISHNGKRAYLSNWDAGLVLLDLKDATDPKLVSVALDPDNGSLDGEVNSHAAWPSRDGRVVVEGEEDFSPFEVTFNITDGPNVGEYPSAEGAITIPIFTLPGGEMGGPTVYVGLACPGDTLPAATAPGQIALIQRGICFFSEKIDNAEAAGYEGVVVFNDEARGDALVSMGGDPTNLPGVFVGHSTGLAIMDVSSAADLVIGAGGASISATAVPNAWSGLRIWDYSDPANPVLASTFNTVCSANPVDPSCDSRGVYSAHNVMVEGNKVYISWYSDGVLVLDISDPANPKEIARYNPTGADFEAQNGGIQDVWGIFKDKRMNLIYASDRNGGLYVLKLKR